MTLLSGARTSVLALAFVAGAGLPVAQATNPAPKNPRTKPATEAAPAVDPRVRESLARMGAFVKTLHEFSIHAETTKDEIVQNDYKVKKSATVDLTVRNPDRLRASAVGDDENREFFYDGKTLTIYSPAQKLYATMDSPPTIAATLDAAKAHYDLELPLADLLYLATGDDLGKNAIEAGFIGPSRVGGVDCEHLALRSPEVDWQIWIEKGDKPLPRRVVITTRNEPTAPQYSAIVSWNLLPKVDDGMFSFKAPDGASAVPILPAPVAKAPPAANAATKRPSK
ncbi:MAG: DUF2092 domain-containing protein [Polyangiaceae bacterium]